jgi:glycosyltransferase involved in cell wall biosynthesis
MKVAWYSPLPPERSGIAAYSAVLLPALRERVEVETVSRGEPAADAAAVRVYHVGNDPERHAWIVEALRRAPGIVVLHDFVLHHLVVGMTLARGDRDGYLRAMRREAGPEGQLLAEGAIAGIAPPLWETDAERFPLVGEVLDSAGGVIVHSGYVEQKLRDGGYAGPVLRVPLPIRVDEAEAARLPFPGRPVLGSFGHLNASKRVPQLLQAFARLRRGHPDAVLLLGGTVSPDVRLGLRLEALGLVEGTDVIELGYLSHADLAAAMRACDVCVSLRGPTMGETSASALEALALARPLVVSDTGWFSELPDGVVAKVPAGRLEVETLAATIELLVADERLRERMGEAGLAYVGAEHGVDRAADAFAAAVGELAARDEAAA